MDLPSQSRIFISYSHRGDGPKWKAALLRSLHVFERHHLLDVWQDGKIRVSSFWDGDVKQAMGSAQLAVVRDQGSARIGIHPQYRIPIPA